jgi:hypothetical protein
MVNNRMQVSAALEKAGLHKSDYARQILLRMQPLPQPELVSKIKLG